MLPKSAPKVTLRTKPDRRKELYLIINIPYIVNMPIEEKAIPKRVELLPADLPKVFHEQRDEIEKIKSEIDILKKANSIYEERIGELEKNIRQLLEENKKQKEEIEILKKENLRLKIVSGETKSGWKIERDWIYRNNPITGEPEGYRCPINFNIELVSKVKIFIEDGIKWYKFRHKDSRGFAPECCIPHECYLFLKGELPEQKKEKAKKTKIQKLEFKEKDDIIEYLENYFIDSNKNISQLGYLEKAVDFLWGFKDKKDKDKKFGTGDFRRHLDFCSPATVASYLDMFVECDIIIRLGQGSYRVNFK